MNKIRRQEREPRFHIQGIFTPDIHLDVIRKLLADFIHDRMDSLAHLNETAFFAGIDLHTHGRLVLKAGKTAFLLKSVDYLGDILYEQAAAIRECHQWSGGKVRVRCGLCISSDNDSTVFIL